PLAPTLAPVAESGVEGAAIALNLGAAVNGLAGDANSLASLVVSAIPIGATLSDGSHSFTADASHTAIDIHGWSLSSLTITPPSDANFTLSVAATARDGEGNLSTTTTATEAVTVNPLAPTLAPVAESGVEGAAIALNLGAAVNGLAGDANSLASLVVSAIPIGATLSDGAGGHSFTADASHSSVDVSGWTLSSLTITPSNDANFTLSVAATARDGEGNLSATTAATETVMVNPLAPTLAPVAESGVEGAAIALNLGAAVNGLAGDANSLASLVVSAIPIGATLSDGSHSFTADASHTAIDIHGWSLSSLTITPPSDANFTLSVAATARDGEGNLSTTTTATEAVTVNPLAPTLAPVAESGVEGAAIALNLGAAVNGLAGDANSLASLVVSAIPIGATLSDGSHSFTADASHTAIDIHGWSLSSLTITPPSDANFTLSVAATARDGEGNLSTTATATEAVTVNPLAPTLAPVAESGVEGAAIALNLGATVNGLAGEGNSLASVVVSAIPIGATLSDGAGGHSFTADASHTTIDIHGWTLSSLTITPSSDANFTLSVAATARDGEGNLSTTTTATEAVTVNPLAPTLAPVAESGVEGAAIALNLGAAVNGLAGDGNSLASLVVSAIPNGATLSDGSHSFTADASHTAVDIHGWTLSSLTVTPPSDANFTLSVAATARDGEGNLSTTTTATEAVTVNPLAPTLAPVAESGVEGTAIALNLGATVNGLAGDANSLASLVVSAIPAGATLSDGSHSFTADASHSSVDVSGWTLSSLTITPPSDANFTLSVAATARDGEGNLSATTTATEAVTVNPLAPTLAPVAESGVEGAAIALNLGAAVNGLAGDANSLATLVVSAIPAGATLSDGSHTFHADASHSSVDVSGWTLSSLTITPPSDANFTLSVAATARDGEGNLSATTTATEAVTVNPLAPTLAPVAESGVEGTAIALNLGATVNGLAGDGNSLATLVVSAIPVGATLSDGAGGHSFTADASHTAIDIHSWTLSSLTITPSSDANFTLSVAATARDGEGNLSTTTTATEAVTVNPLAPTLSWAASAAGLEGTAIALGSLGVTIANLGGDANVQNSLTISGVPLNAVFSDGHGHTHTSSGTSDTIDLTGWTLSSLTVTPTNDTNFTLTARATEKDAEGNSSGTTTATEAVTVNPLAPTLSWAASAAGVEGAAIVLGSLGATIANLGSDANLQNTLTISGVPLNAVFSDGHGHTHTSSGTSDTIDLTGWTLSSLTVTPTNDTNFTLTARATEKDVEGNVSSTTTAIEAVTVNPTAPAVTWPTSFQITNGANQTLGALTVSVTAKPGDTNTIQALLISGIPSATTLSDGAGHTFTADASHGSVDVSGWSLSNPLHISNAPNNSTFTLTMSATERDAEGNVSATTTATETVRVGNPPAGPAGIAGSAINLALSDPTADPGDTVSITITGVPSGWVVSNGTDLGHGTWSVQTTDPTALTITTPENFAGATMLGVTETWTNADGSTGTVTIADNVEAYAPGSPIFAWSGTDHLTGANGSDLFVFAQPIQNDTIHAFNAAMDKIDLVGFAGVTNFSDVQAHMTNDANGNAVIALDSGETITVVGVSTAALTSDNFVFNQEPVMSNAGTMVVSDSAMLPLGGTILNTGSIVLNALGNETDLEVLSDGITLRGGGQVTLSDSSGNVIFGTAPGTVFTNIDNTISGAGHIGGGPMALVNDGTIIANGVNALDIDTGLNNVVNAGTLEATGSGGLIVHGSVTNSGVLWAHGGNLTVTGDVHGTGVANIDGGATLEYGAAASENTMFAAGSNGTLKLDDSSAFTGTVSGLGDGNRLDLADILGGPETTLAFAASQDGSGGTLTVSDGTHTAHIDLKGQYELQGFHLTTDNGGGALISYLLNATSTGHV
ncbi:beta strand repeat-containing protein, partial [Cupriavidus lacunae]